MSAIENIRNLDIPTNSYIKAHLALRDRKDFDRLNYKDLINNVIDGHHVSNIDDRVAQYTFLYIVQEAVRNNMNGVEMSDWELFDLANRKAEKYIKNNSWVFAKPDEEPKVDSEGNPKKKKGAKKDMAIELYGKYRNEKSRKEIIQLFIDEIGMSKAGATTYYHNMKKEFGDK